MKKEIRVFFIIIFSVMPLLFFAQNVGIGTTLPTEKLDIAGNLRVDTLKPAIIGSNEDDDVIGSNQGSASIYQFDGSSWILMQKIFETLGYGGANYRFGSSVSISGNYSIVGTNSGANQGSASIYQFNGSNWTLMQKIYNTNGVLADYFGCSVAISGNYAVVGALSDDEAVSGNEGSASIFIRLGNTWQRIQHCIDPYANPADHFGTCVSIDGSTKRFIIGVPNYAIARGKSVFGKVN
ncbi:MAG TPA: hypothetical protein VFG10_10260 [Saprospiraceae bacterium]|nr:hypothetical protein [Saprospiraceae bacterium]